ncbi:hypothetical protein TSAR_011651 [Trichomalopsis sarcophagae]|uniref:Uncharacterized protein n=1 Tax=Trichomalopsis sarcophagae TaxID=543379 RepID=A0A232EZ07_9HYME|nr:hypothetical protein TSAR_011651 [Trichomalopsis sarcophagae]
MCTNFNDELSYTSDHFNVFDAKWPTISSKFRVIGKFAVGSFLIKNMHCDIGLPHYQAVEYQTSLETLCGRTSHCLRGTCLLFTIRS